MISQMADRPPHVAFEVRAVEFRDPDGTARYRDEDFAIVTPPGGNLVVERIAKDWMQQLREAQNPLYDHVKRLFDFWKEGQEPPLDGTPLDRASFSPAEIKAMRAAGVRSIEDMAQFPDGQLGRIGMGARGLKNRSIAWVDAKADRNVADQLAALRVQIAEMKADNERLRQLNIEIKTELAQRERDEQEPTPRRRGRQAKTQDEAA